MFCIVPAIVSITASGGGRRAGRGGTAAAVATTAATTISTSTTTGRPTSFHAGSLRDQRRAGGHALRERFDRGRASVLRGGGAVGRVPGASSAARSTTDATTAPAAHTESGRPASEWTGTVCDPVL